MIKKILKGAGITLLVLVALIIGAGVWTGYKSAKYEKTAIPYMVKAIPEISKWKPDIMRSYMSPEIMAEVSDEDFIQMTNVLSKMGALVSTAEPVFQSVRTSSSVQTGSMTLVTYIVPAIYENGDAKLTVVLKEKNESFEIHRFNVDSMALFR